ncbi:MAG: hypothetical protein LBK06_03335 [Planctomycetaceae bacterium]|nr:hypothetical protein [Planctomycetaceae bacterium]
MGRDVHNRRWSDSATAGNTPPTHKAPQGRDYKRTDLCAGCDSPQPPVTHLAPAGLEELEVFVPAVALRSTAGYAHLVPAGLKEKNKTKNLIR